MHILMNASLFSVEKLKNKIVASTSCGGVTDVVTAIPQATLHSVWREMQDRLDICRATNGAHVEGH
jgi:NAD(P)H-nitrite reductase large subunit